MTCCEPTILEWVVLVIVIGCVAPILYAVGMALTDGWKD